MKLSYSETQSIMYNANSIEELRLNLFKHFDKKFKKSLRKC